MKKRILIGYASNDFCQEKIANILFDYFNQFTNYEVFLLNIYDYSNSYLNNFNRLSFIKKFADSKIVNIKNLKLFVKNFDSLELRNVFKSFNPDVVVSLHFYVNYVACFYKNDNIIESTILSVVPDYACHYLWTFYSDVVDYYLVDSDHVKRSFVKYGVPSEKLVICGVPIASSQDVSKEILVKRYNLNPNNPIYLFFGENDEDFNFFKDLVIRNYDLNLVFVCNKNKFIKGLCEKFIRFNNIRNVVILCFGKDVFNILNIADVVISRPKGYNLSQIVGFKKPSILLPSLHAVERKNSVFMCKKNFSVKVSSPSSLSRKVHSFLSYPFIVNSMANKLLKIDLNVSCKILKDLIDNNLKK